MKPAIQWTKLAISDLDAIFDYLAEEDPTYIEPLFLTIQEAVNGLAAFPMKGRKGRVPGTRELVISGTPYIVAYVERKHQVEVIAVIHGARRWPHQF